MGGFIHDPVIMIIIYKSDDHLIWRYDTLLNQVYCNFVQWSVTLITINVLLLYLYVQLSGELLYSWLIYFYLFSRIARANWKITSRALQMSLWQMSSLWKPRLELDYGRAEESLLHYNCHVTGGQLPISA